jgi:hypothetical protein
MRCVSSAIWTSGEPVSPGVRAKRSMMSLLVRGEFGRQRRSLSCRGPAPSGRGGRGPPTVRHLLPTTTTVRRDRPGRWVPDARSGTARPDRRLRWPGVSHSPPGTANGRPDALTGLPGPIRPRRSGPGRCTRRPPDAGDQGLRAVEPLLPPDPGDEGEVQAPAVQVRPAVDEEVRLDRAGGAVEGRAPADVDDRGDAPSPSGVAQHAYTPSAGSARPGSTATFAVGTPMVRPRPSPRTTSPPSVYGRPSPRVTAARSPAASSARSALDDTGHPEVDQPTASTANPCSTAERPQQSSTSPAARCPNRKFSPTTTAAAPPVARRARQRRRPRGSARRAPRRRSRRRRRRRPCGRSAATRSSSDCRAGGTASGRSTAAGWGSKVSATARARSAAADGDRTVDERDGARGGRRRSCRW